MDAHEKLRQNRPAMAELFASKGWALLMEWTEAQTAAKFEQAIRAQTAEERETARVSGLTMEEFVRLSLHLADIAGLSNAEEAPGQSVPATSEAQ